MMRFMILPNPNYCVCPSYFLSRRTREMDVSLVRFQAQILHGGGTNRKIKQAEAGICLLLWLTAINQLAL
jgi:hypothetical protein